MTQTRCPICENPVPKNAEVFPFCSPRCKLIDLGNWLGDRYRIPGQTVNADEEVWSETSDDH